MDGGLNIMIIVGLKALKMNFVKDGIVVGFRPESEGITLEEAYEKARI